MTQNVLQNQAALDRRFRITLIIFAAQILSTIFLVVVTFVAAPRIDAGQDAPDSTNLWIGLMFIAVGSFIIRRMLMSWERIRNISLLKGIDGMLVSLQRTTIILGALGEIVAVIGFVIAALSGDPFDMFRAGLIALIVFGINFPRKNVWRRIVASLEQA